MQICEGKRKDSRYFVRHKLFCFVIYAELSPKKQRRGPRNLGVCLGDGGVGGGGAEGVGGLYLTLHCHQVISARRLTAMRVILMLR